MKISRLNNAKIIILDNQFCHIIIDKINHNIIQTRQWNDMVNEDVTEECEQMEREYTVGDMVIETPYKGGIVMSKLLNNRTDGRCLNFIDIFNIELIAE